MQVSVLTPVYNAEPYLREAVESAVAQEETAEVIVVEDGSTDGSRALCEQLEREYSKVKLLGFTDGRAHWIGDKYNLRKLRLHRVPGGRRLLSPRTFREGTRGFRSGR